MKKFSIGRINTKMGIFRLLGQFSPAKSDFVIIYHRVEFMSTDGWCELDIDSSRGKDIIDAIKVEVAGHLV